MATGICNGKNPFALKNILNVWTTQAVQLYGSLLAAFIEGEGKREMDRPPDSEQINA